MVSKRSRAIFIGAVVLAGAVALGSFITHQVVVRNAKELTLYGNVDIRQVDVAFRVSGRINEVLVDEGASVTAGQVLARLDADLLRQALKQAEANVAGQRAQLALLESGYRKEEVARAEASVREARAQADNARYECRRVENLRKSNAVSQKILDNARAEASATAARLRAAQDNLDMLTSGYREEDILRQKAALQAAEAEMDQAAIHLGDAELKAPQDGVVLTRAREAGAIVQTGQTVYTLSLTNPVWVRAYVDEPQLGNVKPGMPVTLEVDAAPGKRFSGTVGFISPTAEFTPKSVETHDVRTALVYRIRIQAQDPENVMRQGMPITVRVPLPSKD